MTNILNLRKKNKLKKARPTKKSKKDNLEWSAPEFTQYNKNKSWFIIVGLIAGGLLLWALLAKNILFALMIGLAYFAITFYALKQPRNIYLAINPRGVKIDKTLYSFDNLKSFWIFYDPPEIKEISLRSKKMIMPYIKIPLGKQNPVEVRRTLIKYLPERKHKESLIDNLTRELRF